MEVETTSSADMERRIPLTRRRVLEAAVNLADRHGIESVSMRRLAQELRIEAMSLYTHVRSKEDLLDGMVEIVIGQIPAARGRGDWKRALRRMIMAARGVLLHHPWAPHIIKEQFEPGPAVLRHFDTVIGTLREAGFSIDLTHHALHLLGSRVLGFTHELFDDSPGLGRTDAATSAAQIAAAYPNVAEMALAVTHEGGLGGCDTDREFEFSLDIMLDCLERLRDAAKT